MRLNYPPRPPACLPAFWLPALLFSRLFSCRFSPATYGAAMALPVGFAWSLWGYISARVYLQQQRLQETGGKTTGWLSPVLAGAVAANIGMAWHGSIMGWGYLGALSRYYAGEVSMFA